MTWGLGSPFSIHIGASGTDICDACYMIGGAVFASVGLFVAVYYGAALVYFKRGLSVKQASLFAPIWCLVLVY